MLDKNGNRNFLNLTSCYWVDSGKKSIFSVIFQGKYALFCSKTQGNSGKIIYWLLSEPCTVTIHDLKYEIDVNFSLPQVVTDVDYIKSWGKVYMAFEDIEIFWKKNSGKRLVKRKLVGHSGTVDALHVMPSRKIYISGKIK